MTDLKEIRTKVDIKIDELRRQAYFAVNNYDYHHKNDELQIIEKQIEILDQVAGTYTRFLDEMQKFNQTLNDAKQLSAQFDQLLVQSQPTTQQQSPSPSPSPPNERQHETKTTSKNLHPLSCTKKDKLKDTTSKKQLFPPS